MRSRPSTLLLGVAVLVGAGCGLRTERMVPDVRASDVALDRHVVRTVTVSSEYSAASLRVVTPEMLRDVLTRGLAKAGAYGGDGRYVLEARITKLGGGSVPSGWGARFALVTIESRLVDTMDAGWDWHTNASASPGLFPFPGLERYTGVDADRRAFEAAVREATATLVTGVRDSLARRAVAERAGAIGNRQPR